MKIIFDLKKRYEIEKIENSFIKFYVFKNNLKVKNNRFLKKIIDEKKDIENQVIFNEINNNFESIKIYDLVKIFELLIPDSDRKINGAFFTPQFITNFIIKNTITSTNQSICDPSCGCGAFLLDAVDYIKNKFQIKDIKQIIEKQIYGVDIADYSVRRTKILLSLYAIENGFDSNFNFNIKSTDSLRVGWSKLFPEITKDGGFDVVVGNPPYVKFQDLSTELREDLYKNWTTLKKGNYNLYFAFFELGIHLVKDDGVLGFITPNNYFTSIAGVNLRKFLNENKYIKKILDFNHLKVFDAQTYTCITFLDKKNKDKFLYEKIHEKSKLQKLDKAKYSKILYKDLDDKKWRLLRGSDQENIKKIENTGQKLGEIADIRVGVATCKDIVYFIEDGDKLIDSLYYKKHFNGKDYLIEKDITKVIDKISDFKDQESLNKNKRRIIFPYKKMNEKVVLIKEDELHKQFPKCYDYLSDAKKELSKRDKGKVKYDTWYSYARSQGLNFYGEKLLTPTFSSKPRFLTEENPDSLFCNGYAVYPKKEQTLFFPNTLGLVVLSKILNSVVMDYYIKNTSVIIEGGYPCYQKNFIELFTIPNLNKKDINWLKKEKNKENIDKFLIEKYGIEIIL